MVRPSGSEKGHELDIAKLLVDNNANTTILNQLVSRNYKSPYIYMLDIANNILCYLLDIQNFFNSI